MEQPGGTSARRLYNDLVTLRLARLRCWMEAQQKCVFPTPASNALRGMLGYRLHARGDGSYETFFAPKRTSGPSGLADPPRPFVLRSHWLDGQSLERGQHYSFDLHAFDLRLDWRALLSEVLGSTRYGSLLRIEDELVELDVAGTAPAVEKLRIHFITPTELKVAGKILLRPDFEVLVKRARDRISGLRSLYGAGPLELDFAELGRRAAGITMTECDVREVSASRRSGNSGQLHSLGGFMGSALYEGELGEFVPLLRATEWTGVGRQTSWGKGAIQVEL